MDGTDDKVRRADALRDEMLQIISRLDGAQLAALARHEYDDEAVTPPAGSPGEVLLFDGRDRFIDWVRAQRRWPQEAEAEGASATWHHAEAAFSQRAQAFVDLGLYFSTHAICAADASVTGLGRVLDSAMESLAVNLTMEYGPQV